MTPSRIIAEYDGKPVTILVEALLPGYGSPNFVIFSNSIARWDPPWEHVEFTDDDKQRVMNGLREDLSEKKITFEFE